jgi:hypothetical protein
MWHETPKGEKNDEEKYIKEEVKKLLKKNIPKHFFQNQHFFLDKKESFW